MVILLATLHRLIALILLLIQSKWGLISHTSLQTTKPWNNNTLLKTFLRRVTHYCVVGDLELLKTSPLHVRQGKHFLKMFLSVLKCSLKNFLKILYKCSLNTCLVNISWRHHCMNILKTFRMYCEQFLYQLHGRCYGLVYYIVYGIVPCGWECMYSVCTNHTNSTNEILSPLETWDINHTLVYNPS